MALKMEGSVCGFFIGVLLAIKIIALVCLKK